MKIKRVLKVLSVLVITALLLLLCSNILTPTWYSWNNDNIFKGFYREPEDRLQVVFVGTSQSLNGIAPMELYSRYGICAYNLSSEQQPLLASYYWIKEAERLHGKTLQAAVLDLSFVFRNETKTSKMSMNEKALAHMRFSGVKMEAYRALAKQYGVSTVEYIIPLIRYHSRWSDLEEDDFSGLTTKKNSFFTRGQNLEFELSHDREKPSDMFIPQHEITEAIDHSQKEINALITEQNLEYIDQIVAFCKEKNIDLVFLKIAKATTDLEHDAMQYLADSHDVPLVDFNLISLQEEIGLDTSYDYRDGKHANVSGAEKITKYIGAFLTERYHFDDVRNDSKYDYMKEQYADYRAVEDSIRLIRCENLDEYIRLLDNDRYTVFVSAKDNAATGLSEEERKALSALGFKELESIGLRESYIGIVSRGKTVLDKKGESDEQVSADGTFDEKTGCKIKKEYRLKTDSDGKVKGEKPTLLKGEGFFSVESAGKRAGNRSVININGKNYSDSKRGLNFVVYDHTLKTIVDTSGFDTGAKEPRRTDMDLKYEYLMRIDASWLALSHTIADYITTGNEADSCTVILCGTMSKNKSILSDSDKDVLKKCGVPDTAQIEENPFVLIIREGKLLLYETADASGSLDVVLDGLLNVSAEKLPEKDLSLQIAGETYKVGKNCVFAVAYNGKQNCVMNTQYLYKGE